MVEVHIDEKWFYAQKVGGNLYMPPDVTVIPNQYLKSKSYVPKVMFIAAVARPIIDLERGIHFNGLLAFNPLVMREYFYSDAKYGKTGDEYYYNVTMNGARFKEFLTKKLVPDIHAKCSWAHKVIVQFDGAGGHGLGKSNNTVKKLNEWSRQAHKRDPSKPLIEFRRQRAHSPDLNILDLGAWHSLQTAVDVVKFSKPGEGKMETLIVIACIKAWEETWSGPEKLTSLFAYLEKQIWQCVIDHKGLNKYKLPHRTIEERRQLKEISESLRCDLADVEWSCTDERLQDATTSAEIMGYLSKYIIFDKAVPNPKTKEKLQSNMRKRKAAGQPPLKRQKFAMRSIVESDDEEGFDVSDDSSDEECMEQDKYDDGGEADAAVDIDDEELVKCVCNHNASHTGERSFMIKCDACKYWFHGRCVNITKHNIPKIFSCPSCAIKVKNEQDAKQRADRAESKRGK